MRPALRPLAFLSILAVVLFGACQQLPQRRGAHVAVLEVGGLEQRNPSDVLVTPLEYVEEGLQGPDRPLRQAFVRGLVKRHYAPLALDYVDARVTEASFPMTSLQADAVCRLIVHNWDESLWDARRALIIDLELRMVDPADPLGPALWAGRLDQRLDLSDEEIHFTTESALYQAALGRVADELLAAMPARDTQPGFE